MRTRRTSSLLTAAVLAGGAAGFLLDRALRGPAPPAGGELALAFRQEADSLRLEVERLREEARRREKLLSELALDREADKAKQAAPEENAAPERGKLVAAGKPAGPPYRLASVEEADAVFKEALERLDLEAVWNLAAALLDMGEDGYRKVIDLLDAFEKAERQDEGIRALMQNPLHMGRFLRAVADHHEGVLRFGLYLKSREAESLPRTASSIRKDLFQGVGAILLGFNEGESAEIQEGYLEVLEKDLETTEPTEKTVHFLAQIQGERATDLLIGIMGRVANPLQREVVQALAFRRDRRALPALQELRADAQDPELIRSLDAALKALE